MANLVFGIDTKMDHAIGCAEGTLGRKMMKVRAVCSPHEPTDGPLSVGNLPRDWKPVQQSHVRMPEEKHRLYFWAHGPEISRYLVAQSKDGRRFRKVQAGHHACNEKIDLEIINEPKTLSCLYPRDVLRAMGH